MFVFGCCKPLLAPERQKEVALTPNEGSPTAPIFDVEMLRSKSETRILQRTTGPSNNDRRSSTNSARSLFEASACRVASHSSIYNSRGPGLPDSDSGGLPEKFLELYVAALKNSNPSWATESLDVGDIFASGAKLISQDKTTTSGKSNVLRRLDQGVETLIKMAGKDAAIPEWEITGPVLTEALEHEYRCTVKRGMMKFSFKLEFLIINGKIAQLRNTRL